MNDRKDSMFSAFRVGPVPRRNDENMESLIIIVLVTRIFSDDDEKFIQKVGAEHNNYYNQPSIHTLLRYLDKPGILRKHMASPWLE